MDAYERGDFTTALREWKPLAEQGYDEAQNNLGVMYFNGYGVAQDYREAEKWYRLAAEQDHAAAQHNLSRMYVIGIGIGVPKDFVYAYMWLTLAVANGNQGSQELRDDVEEKMSSGQIEKAQDFSRECVRNGYQGC